MNQAFDDFKTSFLLRILANLIEMQIFAIYMKRTGLPENFLDPSLRKRHPTWSYIYGICLNVYEVSNKFNSCLEREDVGEVLIQLFVRCPSASSSTTFPVPAGGGVSYNSINPNHMWGNHPYADNRRQVLQECINELTKVLQKRNVKVG